MSILLSEIYKIGLRVIIFLMRSGGVMILSPLADAGWRGYYKSDIKSLLA